MSVYVLSNPSMPGLVKLGRSADAEGRAASLSSFSGVPTPFTIEYQQVVDDDSEVELRAHDLLGIHRVNPFREFFKVSPEDATDAIQSAALMSAWNKAGLEAREDFLARIDKPVFDRSGRASA